MSIERRVRIVHDSDAENPREAYIDFISRMLCWHTRYNLGDEHSYDSDNWKLELACEHDDSLDEYIGRLEDEVWEKLYERTFDNGCVEHVDRCKYVERFIRKRINDRIDAAFDAGYIALPLYLYDHSGITMSTGSFGCKWDSGRVGIIILKRSVVDSEFNGDEDAAYKFLESEVKVYDQYLTGDVWGYVAEERCSEVCSECSRCEDWNEVDSCWGFYGSDPYKNGISDAIDDDFAEALADAIVE